MWIMLRKRLPCLVSPPKMSVHWSAPWPGEAAGEGIPDFTRQQRQTCLRCGTLIRESEPGAQCECADGPEYLTEQTDHTWDEPFGKTSNWAFARKIIYKGEALRVFPHEFSALSEAGLTLLTGVGLLPGEPPPFELVPDGVAQDTVYESVIDGELKPVYEMALLDGCLHEQAVAVALGNDITFPAPGGPPPLGWYRLRPPYVNYFCYAEEQEE